MTDKTKVMQYTDFITLDDLDNAEKFLKEKEIEELNKKLGNVLGSIHNIGDYKDHLLAKKMFTYGYLAAHIYLCKHKNDT